MGISHLWSLGVISINSLAIRELNESAESGLTGLTVSSAPSQTLPSAWVIDHACLGGMQAYFRWFTITESHLPSGYGLTHETDRKYSGFDLSLIGREVDTRVDTETAG